MAKIDDELAKLERQLDTLEKIVKARAADPDDDDYADMRNDAGDDDSDDDEDCDEDDEDKLEKATKFDALVRMVAARDNIPLDQATSRARKEFPDVYAGFRDLTDNTEKSYRSLVEAEIRKGCSPTVAAQRVAYAYPNLAATSIAKADRGAADFMRAVERVMKRDNCSRVQALAKARKENPNGFRQYQNV